MEFCSDEMVFGNEYNVRNRKFEELFQKIEFVIGFKKYIQKSICIHFDSI